MPFVKLIHTIRGEYSSNRPYAGPAFLNSPPPSALPMPRFAGFSLPIPKVKTINPQQLNSISFSETSERNETASSPHEQDVSTHAYEAASKGQNPVQTWDNTAARSMEHARTTERSRSHSPRVDRYGRIQPSGKPLEIWERHARQEKAVTGHTTPRVEEYGRIQPSGRSHEIWERHASQDKITNGHTTTRVDRYGRIQPSGKPLEIWERHAGKVNTTDRRASLATTESGLDQKASNMNQNWRAPIADNMHAKQTRFDSDNDDETLFSEGEFSDDKSECTLMNEDGWGGANAVLDKGRAIS